MPKDTFRELEDNAFVYWRLFNKIMWGRKYPLDYGTGDLLYWSEMEILDRVSRCDEATVTLLAELLGVSKAALSPIVNKLEKKGYLRKRLASTHGNARSLSLTAKGRVALKGLRFHLKRLHHYMDGITRAEMNSFIKVLGCIGANVDGELGKQFNSQPKPGGLNRKPRLARGSPAGDD